MNLIFLYFIGCCVKQLRKIKSDRSFKCYFQTWKVFLVFLSSLPCILRQISFYFGFTSVCFRHVYMYDIGNRKFFILLRLVFHFIIFFFSRYMYTLNNAIIRLIQCASLLESCDLYLHITSIFCCQNCVQIIEQIHYLIFIC